MTLEKLAEFDKEGIVNTSEAKELALRAYKEGLPEHRCYWNDRFYIAVRFGLDEHLQREAVITSIVKNGRDGYFELITHFGFDAGRLIHGFGIPQKLLPQLPKQGGGLRDPTEEDEKALGYLTLEEGVIRKVSERFGVNPDGEKEKWIAFSKIQELGVSPEAYLALVGVKPE